MNIWNKVLIGLICPLAILAIFWSAKVLNHYVKRGTEIKKIEDDTANAIKSIETYRDYDKGIPMLEVRNAALLSDRAENWRDCTPKSVQPSQDKRARIVFSVKQDSPSTMKVGDTIYVFDQRPFGKGGQYLGRFAVTQAQGADIAADSLDVLSDLELQNLVSSQQDAARDTPIAQNTQDDPAQVQEPVGPEQAAWSVFSRCPTDRPDLFQEISDNEKEKYLLENIRNLYFQNPDFKPLDFGTLFTHYFKKRIETAAQFAEKQLHKSEIDESNRLASVALTVCQNENEQLNQEIEQMKAQRQEVEELCKDLDAICNQLKSKIQQTQRENERMTEEIRKYQMEALQKSGRTAVEPAGTISR